MNVIRRVESPQSAFIGRGVLITLGVPATQALQAPAESCKATSRDPSTRELKTLDLIV